MENNEAPCPHCTKQIPLYAWSVKYRARKLGNVRVTCPWCNQFVTIVAHFSFTAEK